MIEFISLGEARALQDEAVAAGILFNESCSFLGAFAEDELVGIVGYKISGKRATLKCDYTKPAFRNQGIFTRLHLYRLRYLSQAGIRHCQANCTPEALGIHLRYGARIIKQYKNGIVKVGYDG